MKSMPQDAVAIVPARGGSKRIPRKNIRPFLGKPILGRVLEQLHAAGCFDEVMVSTDDQEIADTARAHGASVPFMRSAQTADDHATTAAVLLEVLAAYARQGREFTHLCCVYPTAVFITPQLLRQGLQKLAGEGVDSVVPVLRVSFPIQRAFKVEAGRLAMFQPEHMNTHSRDLPVAYHDSGQFYWLRTRSFLEQRSIYMRQSVPLVIDEMQAHDIDTEDDWRIAELKYGYLQQRAPR